MNAPTTPAPLHASNTYRNAVLTAIAGMLVVIAADGKIRVTSDANAQGSVTAIGGSVGSSEETAGGRTSAVDQRKQMINELERVTTKLDHIEALLSKGLTVKVSEMPRMDMGKSDKNDKGDDAGK